MNDRRGRFRLPLIVLTLVATSFALAASSVALLLDGPDPLLISGIVLLSIPCTIIAVAGVSRSFAEDGNEAVDLFRHIRGCTPSDELSAWVCSFSSGSDGRDFSAEPINCVDDPQDTTLDRLKEVASRLLSTKHGRYIGKNDLELSHGEWALIELEETGERRIGILIRVNRLNTRPETELQARVAYEDGELFKYAVEKAKDSIWSWQVETGEVFFSRQSFLMLGEEVKDDAGFEWWESRVHPDDLPGVKEQLENHMHSGATYDVQYRMRHANGTYLWWQSRGVAIRDGNGKAIKMVGLTSNITELVEAKSEAETLSTQKSVVLRGVSGEVQPAASTITEMAAALYTTRLTKEQRTYLDGIKRATVQLNTFTEQIKEYTEIEDTDTVRAAPEQIFCIEQTLDRVAARWAPIASKKGLSFRADNGCQGTFIGDVSKIESILDKLLSNAVKFTDAGEVGMACQEESPVAGVRQSLRIDITDTGRGMEESIQRRVFEPFVTAQNTQDGQPAGTGLGLATAQRLTSAIDGRLTISNRPDGGVAASLSVPVIPTVDRESDPRTLVDQKSTGKLNVLVAEDDELNQFVIKTMMEYHGHSLTLAKNGVEVLDLWRRGTFDLVLMDIQMPVMDGQEATIELRRLEVEANRKRTPVIALTANALEHQVEEYLASGVDAFVAKPILEEELLEKISLVTRDARAAA